MYTALAKLVDELGIDDRDRTCAAFAANPGGWPPKPWSVCPAIVGGKRHLPWLTVKQFAHVPCVTMLREPSSRLVSGWWYCEELSCMGVSVAPPPPPPPGL